MDDTKLFMRHYADFLKKTLFVHGTSPKDVDLRIDVMIGLLAHFDAAGMGTLGPGSPHEELLSYLEKHPLTAEVSAEIASLPRY